ncbi:MAG: MaoC/PaaZ C-terminal domain-containing protein [Acidimicrobiia bacterium]
MPIDLDKALGAALPGADFEWSEKDVILYQLGVGAGTPATDPGELAYTYEPRLKVLPSFGVLPAFPMLLGVLSVEGLSFNLMQLLHGEQDIQLHAALPTSARSSTVGRVAHIYDKGKAALVVVETTTTDAAGKALCDNHFSLFIRGEGGFGGDPGPSQSGEPAPDRTPDHVVESPTMPQQALLYRLSGDPNPLHADPDMAASAGFERPILHGLCSYGIVCKAAVDTAFGGDVGAVARYQARFAGVVLPGETIVTSLWDEGDRVLVAAATKERDTPVITNAVVTRG